MESKICATCGKVMKYNSTGKFGAYYSCINHKSKGCKNISAKYVKSEIVVNSNISHIKLTGQQETIKNAIAEFKNSILVQAGPGCGKSTLLQFVYLTILKNSGKSILALTLGNGSAKDLQEKGIDVVKTINSVTYGITKKIFPKSNLKLNGKKCVKIKDIISECGLIAEDDRRKLTPMLERIIMLLDGFLLLPSSESLDILSNDEGYNLELENTPELVSILQYIENERINTRQVFFDYDESVKIALQFPEYSIKYDVILLDESQDNNKLKQAVIKTWLKSDGILVSVGDVNQSIMNFTGADNNAMQNIKNLFSCIEYPMNISRRVPQNHINEYLKNAFPDVEFSSVKEGGIFINGLDESLLMNSMIADKSAFFIARNNSVLIKPAYAMIKAGYNACILGMDIAEKLNNLIATNQGHDLESTLENLKKYVNGLFEKFQNAKNKNWLIELADMEDTIKSLSEGCFSIDEILLKISTIFSNQKSDFTFMTGHKSKGLENNNVYLYRLDLLYKKAETEKEKNQEKNLHWVMSTRSLNKMVIVKSE